MARSDAWSQFGLDKAKAMHALCASPGAIGAAIGRSRGAVETMLYRKLRLARADAQRAPATRTMTWDPNAVRRLGELVNAGKPLDEIAAAFNATPSGISTAISRFRVKPGATLRSCMCCEKPFFSAGLYNRLCASCSTGELACVAWSVR
ncbi:hypothetical protein [Bradyrhizobium liaoningense]|uniref:hypothetical protein n=1 Tax=Bradyrhizobium liaoningense TaxID=43992 RepID=UPI001BAA88F5|nr:hypothetical protein [Bradyrhizobium liaoningense]MBR0822412.1 hypothetical protein [Bradyrhizobium liaoningense]